MTTTTFDRARRTLGTRPASAMKASILITALTLFTKKRDRMVAAFEEYEEDCRYDATNGHRSHYCVHGVNQWTDYDNICGQCEEGLTTLKDYMPLLRHEALTEARRFWAEADQLVKINADLDRMGIDFDFGTAFETLTSRYKITN